MDSITAGGQTPNIVMCWELGGGLGHLIKGALLARHLIERGCSVSFAVRELATAHPLLPEDHYCLVQAPVCESKPKNWPPPADYAELLLYAGWGQRAELSGLIRGWRGLFDVLNADLVIADHAPTALLAARTLAIPTAHWGHGFGVPTPGWPVFRTWEEIAPERLSHVRELVSDNVNAILSDLESPGMTNIEALFDIGDNFLCTWPELDHYPNRPSANYFGPLWPVGVGTPPTWPLPKQPEAPRIFAYLRPNLPGLPDILHVLNSLDALTLVYLSGHAHLTRTMGGFANITFTERLTDMEAIAHQASLVICSGTDTLHGMAVRGVPTLSLPMNAEQRMGAERLATLGAGCYLLPQTEPSIIPALTTTLRQLLSDPSYRTQARKLQARYSEFDSNSALPGIAERCLALASPRRQ